MSLGATGLPVSVAEGWGREGGGMGSVTADVDGLGEGEFGEDEVRA